MSLILLTVSSLEHIAHRFTIAADHSTLSTRLTSLKYYTIQPLGIHMKTSYCKLLTTLQTQKDCFSFVWFTNICGITTTLKFQSSTKLQYHQQYHQHPCMCLRPGQFPLHRTTDLYEGFLFLHNYHWSIKSRHPYILLYCLMHNVYILYETDMQVTVFLKL